MSEPKWVDGKVIANCPWCQARTNFLTSVGSTQLSYIERTRTRDLDYRAQTVNAGDVKRDRQLFHLVVCAGCGRGGLAIINVGPTPNVDGQLITFYPLSVETATVPDGVPPGILAELREAERCAAIGAYRAASALLRSTLEKVLKANGYTDKAKGPDDKPLGSLPAKIRAATADRVLTPAREIQMDQKVKRLGNDVVHDEWREVPASEYELAREYVAWLLHDFYQDPDTIRTQLEAAHRLPLTTSEADSQPAED